MKLPDGQILEIFILPFSKFFQEKIYLFVEECRKEDIVEQTVQYSCKFIFLLTRVKSCLKLQMLRRVPYFVYFVYFSILCKFSIFLYVSIFYERLIFMHSNI